MQIFSLFGEILLKDNGVENELNKIDKKAREIGNNFDSTFSKIRNGVIKVGAVIGAGFGFKSIIEEGYKLAESASNLTEAQNVVEQTFKSSSKQIEDWTKTTAKSAGISQTASMQWVGFMGAMLKSSGVTEQSAGNMSKSLVQLTGDMSSFYNISTSDMWEKIRSGISGETEPLKQLGINMSVANLEAFALSEGIQKPYDKMSQSEQTILRYNYLMSVTKDAQGDFGRTLSTSFANQVRVAQLNMTTLGQSIGTVLLPYFNSAVTAFNTHMPQIQALVSNVIKNIGDTMKALLPKIGEIIEVVVKLAQDLIPGFGKSTEDAKTKSMDFVKGGLDLIVSSLKFLDEHITAVKIALGLLGAVWVIHQGILLVLNVQLAIQNTLKAAHAIASGIETAQIIALYIAEGIHNGIMIAGTAAQIALNAATTAFGVILAVVTSPIFLVIAALVALGVGIYEIVKHWDTVKAKTLEVWKAISEWVKEHVDKIKQSFNTLGEGIQSLKQKWDDIKNKVSEAMQSIHQTISNIGASVKQKLHDMFDFTLPHIKLPHFNLSGKFSLEPPSIPTIGVNWYASGGIFNSPSIVGVGEAGQEAVLPISKLDEIMAAAIEKVSGNLTGLTLHIENFNNNTEKDIEALAYELEFYRRKIAMGKGGN